MRCLIIGGASGIGYATAKLLMDKGMDVYIVDKNIDTVNLKIDKFIGALQADMCNVTNMLSALQPLFNSFEFEHIVITAGGAHKDEVNLLKDFKPFWGIPYDAVQETIVLNLISQIALINGILNFIDTRLKSITLTSSINSTGRYGLPVYSAAKSGLEGFVRATAEQLGKRGIRINAIVPGSTKTPLTEKEGMNFNLVKKQTALDRYNEASDMAEVGRLLIMSEAMTGQCIVVDSGQTMVSTDRY